MANQSYRSRLDKTVGENNGTARPVHPAQPTLPVKPGRENKTPAPTRYDPTAKDHTFGRASGNPGGNAYGGPSSITPGTKAIQAVVNPQAPTDQVLENIVAVGTAQTAKRGAPGDTHGDDWQVRQLSTDDAAPPSYGMKLPNRPDEIVPPVAKPLGGNNSDFAAELSAKQHGLK